MAQSAWFKPPKKEPLKPLNHQPIFTLPLERKGPDNPLADFPRSEHWRLVTDGWQQIKGMTDFSDKYYNGMIAGYAVMQDFINHKVPLSVELIRRLQASAFKPVADPDELDFRGDDFVFFLLAPNHSESIGISPDRLDDFIKAATQAYDENRWKLMSVDSKYQDAIDQATGDAEEKARDEQADYIDKNRDKLFLSKDQLKKENLMKYFADESKEILFLFATEGAQKRLPLLAKDIEALVKKVPDRKENPKKQTKTDSINPEIKIEDDILGAMLFFIQKFNQDHWFPDGNGRTCMIMLNCFFIKYFNTMAIIDCPGHLTGFSIPELIQEFKENIREFNKYKITAAREYIEELVKKPNKGLENLKRKFSKENHIAMAQINEVFLRIKENVIKIGDKDLRDDILDLLKFLYAVKLNKLAQEELEFIVQKKHALSESGLLRMLEYQTINDAIRVENPNLWKNMTESINALYPKQTEQAEQQGDHKKEQQKENQEDELEENLEDEQEDQEDEQEDQQERHQTQQPPPSPRK